MSRLLPIGATLPLPNPFARPPTTFAAIVAQVRHELETDYASGAPPSASDLDRVAETAVRDLWGGSVTAFVPLLALRAARETLRASE